MQVQYEALGWNFSFDFSMNQILRYHWSVATWKKNYKEKTNEIIKLRERFSVVKFASFLIFVDGAKKKDNGCWFPKCEAIAQRRKRDCVTEISYWYHLYNNSSVKSLHIHLGNVTSVVHIWGQIRCKIFSWKTREELGK